MLGPQPRLAEPILSPWLAMSKKKINKYINSASPKAKLQTPNLQIDYEQYRGVWESTCTGRSKILVRRNKGPFGSKWAESTSTRTHTAPADPHAPSSLSLARRPMQTPPRTLVATAVSAASLVSGSANRTDENSERCHSQREIGVQGNSSTTLVDARSHLSRRKSFI